MYYYRCGCDYIGAHLVFYVFFFNDTATTEIYTYDTLFPYTTLFRSPVGWTALQRASAGSDRPGAMHGACGATARDCRCATGGRRPDRTSAQPWTGRGMRRHDLRGLGKLNRETEGPPSSRKQDSARGAALNDCSGIRSEGRSVGKEWG